MYRTEQAVKRTLEIWGEERHFPSDEDYEALLRESKEGAYRALFDEQKAGRSVDDTVLEIFGYEHELFWDGLPSRPHTTSIISALMFVPRYQQKYIELRQADLQDDPSPAAYEQYNENTLVFRWLKETFGYEPGTRYVWSDTEEEEYGPKDARSTASSEEHVLSGADSPGAEEDGTDADDVVGEEQVWGVEEVAQYLDPLNQLKLARDEDGRFLSRTHYQRLVREVFLDEEFLEEELGDRDVLEFISHGDLSDVVVTEEALDKTSKNPNFRMQMHLSSNASLKSHATLDMFVKFCADETERDTEMAVVNYLRDDAGLRTVGRARAAKLSSSVKLENSPDGTTCTVTARNLQDKTGSPASYAIVTPFVDAVNLTHKVGRFSHLESVRIDALKQLNSAALELHKKAYAGLSAITHPARDVLEKRIRTGGYEEVFKRLVAPEHTPLFEVYQRLGIGKMLDKYLRKHPAFIHGDLHTRNVLIDKDEKLYFIDFEFAGIGIPQEDLTMYIGDRRVELSEKQEIAIVDDYAKKAGLWKRPFRKAYHLMTIQRELQICRYIIERPSAFSSEEKLRESFGYHLRRAGAHARKVFSEKKSRELETAAAAAFSRIGLGQSPDGSYFVELRMIMPSGSYVTVPLKPLRSLSE
jgi:hypothetical protein